MICSTMKIVPLLVTVYTMAITASERQCESQYSHVTVSSHRNSTGHWLATLRLDQKGSSGGTSELMVLDIEPISSRCDGTRTDSLIVKIQGPPPPPSPGYKTSQGFGYYKVHEELISWEEAKEACEKEDAHLLILNSEAEASAVLQLLKNHPNVVRWVHIGFNDKAKEGHYVTVFGQTLEEAGYARWYEGKANGGTSENCGSIWAPTMELNDLPCVTWKTHFICEQNV